MNPLSRSIIIALILNAPVSSCILLNLAEQRALRRQHMLASEIRTRMYALSTEEDPDIPTEELISAQCHKLSEEEVHTSAVVIAAYKNNCISEKAAEIARNNAQAHDASSCVALADFWQTTQEICELEIKRSYIFEP